jgi:cell division protein FtsB
MLGFEHSLASIVSQSMIQKRFLTVRAMTLVVIVLIITFVLAVPIRQLIEQQSRINTLRAQEAANQILIRELNADIQRWQDPAYVKAQAKSRLHYVMPYEVGYIVLEADEAEQVSLQPLTSQPTSTNRPPWYKTLWQSIEQAGDTAAPLQEDE